MPASAWAQHARVFRRISSASNHSIARMHSQPLKQQHRQLAASASRHSVGPRRPTAWGPEASSTAANLWLRATNGPFFARAKNWACSCQEHPNRIVGGGACGGAASFYRFINSGFQISTRARGATDSATGFGPVGCGFESKSLFLGRKGLSTPQKKTEGLGLGPPMPPKKPENPVGPAFTIGFYTAPRRTSHGIAEEIESVVSSSNFVT